MTSCCKPVQTRKAELIASSSPGSSGHFFCLMTTNYLKGIIMKNFKVISMFESFKELFLSTANTAVHRAKNPVLGAFIMSWCAFNWKSLLYLFFSKSNIIDKISYISDNSTWKTVMFYPCLSVITICCLLPWVNNIINVWQAKPLDNNDSIENHRKARKIQRETRLQRLLAKKDITYEKVKTGAEKNIQDMKEEIILSKDRMGQLTSELKERETELRAAQARILELSKVIDETTSKLENLEKAHKQLKDEYKSYKESIHLTTNNSIANRLVDPKIVQMINESAKNLGIAKINNPEISTLLNNPLANINGGLNPANQRKSKSQK